MLGCLHFEHFSHDDGGARRRTGDLDIGVDDDDDDDDDDPKNNDDREAVVVSGSVRVAAAPQPKISAKNAFISANARFAERSL